MTSHRKALLSGICGPICCLETACGDDDTAGPSPARDAGTVVDPQGWEPPIAIPMPDLGIRKTIHAACVIIERLDFDFDNGEKNLSIRPDTDPFQEGMDFTVRLGTSNDLDDLADLPARTAGWDLGPLER